MLSVFRLDPALYGRYCRTPLRLDIAVSRQATVEMNTTATSPITAASVIVSLWQLGLSGLRVDRFISWKMARANSVLYTNVSYV
jgi:hypothetical protein